MRPPAWNGSTCKKKEALGQALLKPLPAQPGADRTRFWALTRLGARALLYGPLNAVVHPQVVESWLDAILPFRAGQRQRAASAGASAWRSWPGGAGSVPSTSTTAIARAC